MGILEEWKVTPEELEEILAENPSLRGFTFGYVNEYKLRKMWFSDPRITNLVKYDNHDRTRKGDIAFSYGGVEVCVEAKSLQTHSIRKVDSGYVGKFQCDASDRRTVRLPNGRKLETTCLVVGEFDLLAVNLFEFEKEWRFAFARNSALPTCTFAKYAPTDRKHLLATLMEVTWPLTPPFRPEPFCLLDEIARDKGRKRKSKS